MSMVAGSTTRPLVDDRVNQVLRVALIHVMQETDTFNPVPTTLDDFRNVALLEGRSVFERVDPASPIAGCLEAVRASGKSVEVVPILRADAQSGGRLTAEALTTLSDKIKQGLHQSGLLDGIIMFLHGAASATGFDDVEGELLAAVRAVAGTGVPLALMLDHHANVTTKMMKNTDVLMAFRTQPHDPFETGRDLTSIALSLFAGGVKPTMAWRKLPMITHQEQFLTSSGPMKEWFDHARRLESEGSALTISLFPMQPWLDVEEAGWSIVAVTDNDVATAEQIADELADHAWSTRERFMKLDNLAVGRAIAFADDASRGVVLLSDTGDSVLGGSTGDSTVILRQLFATNLKHRALVPITDPSVARRLAKTEIGSTVTVQLGGWANSFYAPINVTATVKARRSGSVALAGLPQGSVDMGEAVILEAGNVTMLVTETSGVGGIHPGVYRHLGVEPADYKMIVMKTASNFQYMRDITTAFVRVATPGPTQSDVRSLPWSRIPRPMYPLDVVEDWRA
jgi:microcystin degradation protein MlrC